MEKTARFLIFPIVLMLAVSCSGSKPEPAPAASQPQAGPGMVATMAKMGNLATDPIAQMSFEFDGNPPKEQIGPKVDKVLAMYGLEANNENRSNAGRVLVALRKEQGHSEMSILEKMLNSPAEGKFEDAAARISAAMSQ
jgi:hypothetical protein